MEQNWFSDKQKAEALDGIIEEYLVTQTTPKDEYTGDIRHHFYRFFDGYLDEFIGDFIGRNPQYKERG